MRILGGSHRGRLILTPKGDLTRPSAGMLREALFNMCQGRLENASCLDLFAGSGSLGLEALSRGAAFVTFIEKSKNVCSILKTNLKNLSWENQGRVIMGNVMDHLDLFSREKVSFDLIFADPPYLVDHLPQELLFKVSPLLSKGGVFFLEEGGLFDFILPEGIKLVDQRRYGRSYLYRFEPS